jgi:hypothetical protein
VRALQSCYKKTKAAEKVCRFRNILLKFRLDYKIFLPLLANLYTIETAGLRQSAPEMRRE